MMKTIVFDADDVLLECSEHILTCAKIALGDHIEALNGEFDLTARFGISSAQRDAVFDVFEHHMEHQPVLEGVADVLNELAPYYKLVVVTAINPKVVDRRLKCFTHHGLPLSDIVATGVGMSKRQALEKLCPIYFLDDRLHNLKNAEGLGIHRVWIEVPGEIHEIAHSDSYYESRHRSIVEWYRAEKHKLIPA